MGELQGSLAKGPGVIRKKLIQADAFDISLPNLPAARTEAISHGREITGWEAIFSLLSLSRNQGCKAQAPGPSSSQPPRYASFPHSLCFFLCFFFFFFFFAALLSFDVCLAFLPVSFSESELSDSDDFLSLCFFFFFSWKENLKIQHCMCIFALKNLVINREPLNMIKH